MSTLSGIAVKGEKGKTKYQSIDINSLIRSSRGESSEQQQQKNTAPRKHGMQSLGKVPSARRAPANLPSLRSETTSSDPAVNLVPSGSSGWATTKETAPTTNTVTTATTATNPPPENLNQTNTPPAQCPTGVTPIALTPQQHPPLPGQTPRTLDPGNKSSWSAIMTKSGDAALGYASLVESGRGGRGLSFLAHQSPQFQHEFPSLSGQSSGPMTGQQQTAAGGGQVPPGQQQPQTNRENAQYGPGPSLRPQTEGSWSQGGSRITGGASAGPAGPGNTPGAPAPHLGGPSPAEAAAGIRTNLGQSPNMVGAQAGQHAVGANNASQTNQASNNQHAGGIDMHHYRNIIPPFMYKGNMGPGSNFPAQFPANGPRPRFNYTSDRASPRQDRGERSVVEEEIQTRPIIKEEDLSRMDDISREAGWTASDDIDYNQKLAFSDEEGDDHPHSSHPQTHKKDDNRKETDSKKDLSENKNILREKEHAPKESMPPPLRSWNQLQNQQRDYRGPPGPSPNNFANQHRSAHPPRDEEEIWSERRREQAEKVTSAVERARQRKEDEEKRFQEQTKQAAAKKLQDLENKLREKKQKDEVQQKQQASTGELSNKSPNVQTPAAAAAIMPEWERESRSRTSSSDGSGAVSKDNQHPQEGPPKQQQTSEFRQIDRPSFMRLQQQSGSGGGAEPQISNSTSSGSVGREPGFSRHFQSNLPPRFQKQQAERSGAAAAAAAAAAAQAQGNNRLSPSAERSSQQPVSFSQLYDPGRWAHNHSNSLSSGMKPGSRRSDERDDDRRSSGGSGGHRRYEPTRKQPSEPYYDDYPRRGGGDRYGSKDFDENRHGNWADQHPEPRRNYDSEKDRDHRDRKDHDIYGKGSASHDHSLDEQQTNVNQSHAPASITRGDSSSTEWRSTHDDGLSGGGSGRRSDGHRSDNELQRPQRPDSRDSRVSRDSRASSIHDDSNFKSSMSMSSGSWANDYPEEEPQQKPAMNKQQPLPPQKKAPTQQREIFREDLRDRDRGDRERDTRRQVPGPLGPKGDNQEQDVHGKRLPLKRHDDKKDLSMEKKDSVVSIEIKKEPSSEASWSRKPEPKTTNWADAVSPSFEKEEEEKRSSTIPDHHDDGSMHKFHGGELKPMLVNDLKHGLEKLSIDLKKIDAVDKDMDLDKDVDKQQQQQQREKNLRNRAGSGSARGGQQRLADSNRGSNRQWADRERDRERERGPSNSYIGGSSSSGSSGGRWRGEMSSVPPPPPPSRGGRRGGGGLRSMGGGNRKPGYDRTDSELSGDEMGSMHDQSQQPIKSRSPKPLSSSSSSTSSAVVAAKSEKDERNRAQVAVPTTSSGNNNLSTASTASISQLQPKVKDSTDSGRSDFVRGDKKPEGSSRASCREGFAPSGEPSRRGRGGFRNNASSSGGSSSSGRPSVSSSSGSAAGGRMEGYGPPPSKSPFSSERSADSHDSNKQPQPGSEHHDESAMNEQQSTDNKMANKLPSLTAGMTSTRHTKSPNNQIGNHNPPPLLNNTHQQQQQQQQSSRPLKDKPKRNRSPRRGGRGVSQRGMSMKQNDLGNEDWETTSDNSEEHPIDGHGPGGRPKPYRGGGGGERQNTLDNRNRNDRNREPRGSENKGSKSSNVLSNRGSEKVRNVQNVSDRGPPRNQNIPPLMQQNAQLPNGRPRSQGSANAVPIFGKIGKEAMVTNRVDELKLNDPNVVNQAMNEINVKKSKDNKRVDIEVENCVDDAANVNVQDEGKIDSDGFQEVRSKKNVKDLSRQQQQKEELQPVPKSGKRERSKSKTNGPPPRSGDSSSQSTQPSIPPLMGPPGTGPPKQPFDRTSSRAKLPPRFQKMRNAKQQGVPDSDLPAAKLNVLKDAVAPAPPLINAWEKPFTVGGSANRSPPSPVAGPVTPDLSLMSGLTSTSQAAPLTVDHEPSLTIDANAPNQRSSPDCKVKLGPNKEPSVSGQDKSDTSSPPVQTLIFENTNYSKNTKSSVVPTNEMAMKSKYSNHMKPQRPDIKRSNDDDTEGANQLQQQTLAAAFCNKSSDLSIGKEKQDSIQMPIPYSTSNSSANTSNSAKPEDNTDMKLDFTSFDSDLTQLTEDKTKTSSSLGIPRSSMHITSSVQSSTISPSTAELNFKIASVKKVWENTPMSTVVEHEVVDPSSVVSSAAANNFVSQSFVESSDCDDGYSVSAAAAVATAHPYGQASMKTDISVSNNVCKLVPSQVKSQQQSAGVGGPQLGSSVTGPSPIGPGQSPIGHPPSSMQGALSPPPFNSTGQPSHINYQYPGTQAAATPYGNMSAIPSPPAVLFNTASAQLPAQASGLYGAFQIDQSRSQFTQYSPYPASLQSSYNQQNMYLQQAPPPPPPPPHAPPNAPTADLYQGNLSQYRLTAAAASFGQNQQLSNNPNTVLITSSTNSLMTTAVKPTSQAIGPIGTKAPHFQAPSAPPQPSPMTYIPYDTNQVLSVSGNYMSNSQLVQRPGPNVQPSANSYYNATSAGKPNSNLYVFPGSQTGFYQPSGAAQQTGPHYGLQNFGQHNQNLATGNVASVNLQNFSSPFLTSSGLQLTAAATPQQYRNPAGGLPGPANPASYMNKHQQQDQPRQLKSPSGNTQDMLASVFSSAPQMSSPKSRKQSSTQQPQSNTSQHHNKFQQYTPNLNQSALFMQQNVRGMGAPPRNNMQQNQQRYPAPIQRPPFQPGPNNSQQNQQQSCMSNQQQQSQMNRHRPNIHQQQSQQRNVKMQQYYSGPSSVKMDPSDKVDSHADKMSDNAGHQSGGNKPIVNANEVDNKDVISHQNE